ncbi:peptidase C39 family protein [Kineosporia sp. J2-2]|uniref:Peptidase C39 family protein n=1 Tax=Kineosporia corallincola TaxID=2835133 RepID=A0ABS5TEG7_9ACTN|nr:peptidase C39 family protein [Kineosporia corallincola]MBT0768824.1 peptidase C39 family protein [Kineosporia corallincola]
MSILFLPFDRTDVPGPVRELVPAATLERWCGADRSASRPRLVVATAGHTDTGTGGTWTAVALVTARPHTASVKIVGAAGEPTAIDAVIEAIAADAVESGAVQLKWEGEPAGSAHGFVPMSPPLPSGPGTGTQATGLVRWLVPDVTLHPTPYYAQTTLVSCGAVTALSAAAAVTGDDLTLDADGEVAFWQEATNHPACEPVGLGVALARRHPELAVTVALDTDRPVILEHLDGQERDWRAALQRESRRAAADLGIPVEAERLRLPDLAGAVRAGTGALLLIDLTLMRGLPFPHWVRCTGTAGDTVVLDDPSVDPALGESWVDGHLLPVGVADLDAMAAFGAGGYRGAVLVRRRSNS